MIDLEKLKKLNAERTPGKWGNHNWDPMERPHVIAHSLWNGKDHCDGHFDVPCTKENTEFIAEFANFLPAIIAELEALRKVAEAARSMSIEMKLRPFSPDAWPCAKLNEVLTAYDQATGREDAGS